MTIIYAILMLCFLIFIHEFGHFVAAKACGVKVNEFALGMGPCIVQKQYGETMYSLRAIPIGGYCAMEGEDEDSADDRAFCNKSAGQKAIILVAGSLMNLIAAIILMTVMVFYIGFPSTTISGVEKDSPAAVAGIEVGDQIVQVNGEKINDWYELSDIIKGTEEGEKLKVLVDRNGTEVMCTPEVYKSGGKMIIGVTSAYERDPAKALVYGPKATWDMAKSMYDVLRQLITGDVAAKELSGVVGIVYMVDHSISQGFITFIYFTAIISLNLAIMNMLPFPALDGGRLVFVVIRKITGKAITDKMEGVFHMVGMVLLLMLMVYVTWQDILRFILPVFK